VATKSKKKKRPAGKRPPAPVARAAAPPLFYRQRSFLWLAAALIAAVVAAVIAVVATQGGGGGSTASAGLPNTSDYHSLLVNPTNPRKLVLGTHIGLYVSSDGGRHWRFNALSGDDAMNLARPAGDTICEREHPDAGCSVAYRDAVIGGAKAIGLPPDYLDSLRELLNGS
jgi:hypothetical protein